MAERIDEIARKSRALGLVLGVALAIFGGVVLAAGLGMFRGAPEAHALPITQAPDPVFELCKVWQLQGAEAEDRDFVFDVSDSSQSVEITIPDVAEGSIEKCVVLSASPGLIVIHEQVPDSFDEPTFALFDSDSSQLTSGSSDTFAFLLTPIGCLPPISLPDIPIGTQTEAIVGPGSGEPLCTLVFTNEDNDDPPPTVTPVTPSVTNTPPPTVCAVCNKVTPPPPTSTPVPPTATPAPNTPVPPTATPTTSVATQAPGLTDEQRTATAVAGAKTAAAAVTPKPPATGASPVGTSGQDQGTNLALILVALALIGSGLTLVAAKSRR